MSCHTRACSIILESHPAWNTFTVLHTVHVWAPWRSEQHRRTSSSISSTARIDLEVARGRRPPCLSWTTLPHFSEMCIIAKRFLCTPQRTWGTAQRCRATRQTLHGRKKVAARETGNAGGGRHQRVSVGMVAMTTTTHALSLFTEPSTSASPTVASLIERYTMVFVAGPSRISQGRLHKEG